jgi:hypothetical protein
MNHPHAAAFTRAFDPAHPHPQPKACGESHDATADPDKRHVRSGGRSEWIRFELPISLIDQVSAFVSGIDLTDKIENVVAIAGLVVMQNRKPHPSFDWYYTHLDGGRRDSFGLRKNSMSTPFRRDLSRRAVFGGIASGISWQYRPQPMPLLFD